MFSCLHIIFLCLLMLFACTMKFFFIFEIFKSDSAFVFTEEEVVEEEEDGELFKTGISFTGGDHHPHITAEGATDLDPDLDPIHLVAIKA